MKCVCNMIDKNSSERIKIGNWCNILMERNEYGEYYIVGEADGNAYLKINYCPLCGRKLEQDDEDE